MKVLSVDSCPEAGGFSHKPTGPSLFPPCCIVHLFPEPHPPHAQHPHLCRDSPSSQVVAELPSKATAKAWGKLGVQREALMQPGQLQTLQDAVRQPLHVGVGLHHLLPLGQLAANQVSLPWGEETKVSKPLGEGRWAVD